MSLSGRTVSILTENNHNDIEMWYPIYRMREEGADVVVVGPEAQRYSSKLGHPIAADRAARAVKDQLFDCLIVPGGYAPDLMRLDVAMIEMVRRHAASGCVVAAICHGSWMLASADVIRGKRVTGAASIRDDLVNAGGRFEDAEVMVDGNIITSRKPDDLPAFCREIVRLTAQRPAQADAA